MASLSSYDGFLLYDFSKKKMYPQLDMFICRLP